MSRYFSAHLKQRVFKNICACFSSNVNVTHPSLPYLEHFHFLIGICVVHIDVGHIFLQSVQTIFCINVKIEAGLCGQHVVLVWQLQAFERILEDSQSEAPPGGRLKDKLKTLTSLCMCFASAGQMVRPSRKHDLYHVPVCPGRGTGDTAFWSLSLSCPDSSARDKVHPFGMACCMPNYITCHF